MNTTIKTAIPKLRFPEFEQAAAWEEKTLGEVFNFLTNNSFSRDLLNYESGTARNIHYGDIHTKFNTLFILNKEKVPYVNPNVNIDRLINTKCKEGDIIFADASEDIDDIGKCIELIDLNKEIVLSGLHTIVARANNDVFVLKFKGYLFSSPSIKKRIQFIAQGTKVLGISTKQLSGIKISFPTLPEQEKIAATLCSLDELIAANNAKLEVLKTHKQGLMQQLFPAPGEKVPRLRFPEFANAGDWEEKTLGEICDVCNGRDYKHLENGEIPVYGSGGLMLKVNDYLYDGESVCIGRKGTIDKPMFLKGKFWTVDTLFYTNSFKNCLPYFVFLLFQNINWLEHNEAGGVPSLSKRVINKIEVTLPSLEEQEKIAACLSSLDESITAQSQKIETLQVYKKGLMQGLFPV